MIQRCCPKCVRAIDPGVDCKWCIKAQKKKDKENKAPGNLGSPSGAKN